MAVLGIIIIILALYCTVSWAVTGRIIYLASWIWLLPIGVMVFGGIKDVNGLVVLIGAVYIFELLYLTAGVRLWNSEKLCCNKILFAITIIINLAASLYFAMESYVLGYMPFLNIFGKFGVYISILWGIISTAVAVNIGISVFDKYFSKKEKFVIIKCSSYRGKTKFNTKIRAIKGVQNGNEYIFRATNKCHYMLKNEKSLVMNIKKGVLGGMYVSAKDLMENKPRLQRRINKILIRRGIFTFIALTALVLFVFRVLLGMSFEEIYSSFINVISFKKPI